jgi:sulfite reductase alpha subunit-like flavoprotein
MAEGVKNAMLNIFSSNLEKRDGSDFMDELQGESRYIEEIFGSAPET